MAELKERVQTYEVPKKLRKSLKGDEYAIYRLLGAFDHTGKFHGRDHSIPVTDVIMDTETNEPVTIGYVEKVLPSGKVKFGSIWFDTMSLCQIIVRAGAKDHNLYNYLENSNYNKSNPNADQTIEKSFERVDSTTGVKEQRDKNGAMVKSLTAAMNMSDDEVLTFARNNKDKFRVRINMLPDGRVDYNTIRNQIEHFAKNEPARFLGMSLTVPADTTVDGVMDIITEALKSEAIKFDSEARQYYNKIGRPVFSSSNGDSNKAKKELAVFLGTRKGETLLKAISPKQ